MNNGYESPIYYKSMQEIAEKRDNYIYSQIREIVDVDKEELMKALAYDRDQYDKGYTEGYRRGLEEGKQTGMIALANSILQKWGGESEDESL